MKKTVLSLISIAALSTVLISSCKKKDKEEDITEPEVNQVCDGNGSASYYPLAVGNSRVYAFTFGTVVDITMAVIDTKVIGGKTYYAQVTSGFIGTDTSYYREDPTTHDVYEIDGTETLMVPGNPVVGQVLPSDAGTTSKVTNLNASYSTATCSYTGLLEVTDYDASTSKVVNTAYYKKGLGLVGAFDDNGFDLKLKAATLK
ncbi:MAG TPA: hypothetical protein PLL00_13405 [Bacteroidia bacterium]|jgi:hypothetical protein|nr:hypothetical protein [Bacteroidia bacterium]